MKKFLFIVGILGVLIARADEDTDKDYAANLIGIAEWNWHRDGFDTVMIASFKITNASPWAIKNISVRCTHSGASGTEMDENTRTIYEVFPPHSARTISDFNMGFISPQAENSSAAILDFKFVEPHLSLAELQAEAKNVSDIQSAQAAAAKAKAAAAKRAADAKALKYDEDLAAKGDAFGLLRMGERYRDGDGVTNNLALARDYLQRAAKAGDPTAADELKNLPVK